MPGVTACRTRAAPDVAGPGAGAAGWVVTSRRRAPSQTSRSLASTPPRSPRGTLTLCPSGATSGTATTVPSTRSSGRASVVGRRPGDRHTTSGPDGAVTTDQRPRAASGTGAVPPAVAGAVASRGRRTGARHRAATTAAARRRARARRTSGTPCLVTTPRCLTDARQPRGDGPQPPGLRVPAVGRAQPTARSPCQNCARSAFLSGLPSPVSGSASTAIDLLGRLHRALALLDRVAGSRRPRRRSARAPRAGRRPR